MLPLSMQNKRLALESERHAKSTGPVSRCGLSNKVDDADLLTMKDWTGLSMSSTTGPHPKFVAAAYLQR